MTIRSIKHGLCLFCFVPLLFICTLPEDDAAILLKEGASLFDKGHHKEALELLQEAARLNPDHVLVHQLLGLVYDHLGDTKQALASYSEALRLDPRDADTLYNRGVLYERLENYSLALNDYSEALRLVPNDSEAYNNRGNVYQALGKHKLAIEDYTRGIALAPNNLLLYNNRGNAYSRIKDLERALEDYDKASELTGDLDEFASICRLRLGVLTQKAKDEWGFSQFERWDLDQEAGTLTFSNADGAKAVCSVQVIGTYSNISKTWLWSWDNPSILNPLKRHAREVRIFGHKNKFEKLTTSQWEATEEDGWEMVAIAAKICNARGAYRGPGKTGPTFMTFDDVTLTSGKENP